ncbi:MAG TPA: type VI secretion system baseplate subunit TssE, partial [Phycisphaerae bacterium]|nr:type VI secretion system baseplate subunit TssE [Phycisphaerae bacterium]
RHLRKLLNSRQDMSEAHPDYGLPALTDMTVGVSDNRRLLEAIRGTIEKYEPRLRHVRVALREDVSTNQTPVFRVEGALLSKGGEHRVWYETAVRKTGLFDVEG